LGRAVGDALNHGQTCTIAAGSIGTYDQQHMTNTCFFRAVYHELIKVRNTSADSGDLLFWVHLFLKLVVVRNHQMYASLKVIFELLMICSG
jgi:hypothetical protein